MPFSTAFTYPCFLNDSTQLGNRTWHSVARGASYIVRHVLKCHLDCDAVCVLVGGWGWGKAVFNSIYVQSPSQFTHSCVLGDSTQLGKRTENSVARRVSAHHVFKVRFAWIIWDSCRVQQHLYIITLKYQICVGKGHTIKCTRIRVSMFTTRWGFMQNGCNYLLNKM